MGHCQIGLQLCYTTYRQASAGQATLLPSGASLLYIQYYVHRVITFPSNVDTLVPWNTGIVYWIHAAGYPRRFFY